jgi:transposase-like protein
MMNEAQIGTLMVCTDCQIACQRFGKHRNGLRRFRCASCKRTFTESHERTLGRMYISQDRAVMALQLLLEGNSIRSTERITGMDRNTIMRALVLAGDRCEHLMRTRIVGLQVSDVEADEIWGYVFKKDGHIRAGESDFAMGDAFALSGWSGIASWYWRFTLGNATAYIRTFS